MWTFLADTALDTHLNEVVCLADELSIRGEVLRSSHGHKGDGVLVTEGEVGPAAHGDDALGGRHAIVGYEHLADGAGAALALHEVVDAVQLHRRVSGCSIDLVVLGRSQGPH